jgi:hypothetical protein
MKRKLFFVFFILNYLKKFYPKIDVIYLKNSDFVHLVYHVDLVQNILDKMKMVHLKILGKKEVAFNLTAF